MSIRNIPLVLILFVLHSCIDNNEINEKNKTINRTKTVKKAIPNISFTQVNYYPHDTTSFTEGLLIHKGELYESTGSPDNLPQTKSLFGIVNLTSGEIDVKVELDRNKFFGEGIVVLNEIIYQLTYKSRKGFIYSSYTFEKIGEFRCPTEEGWGLTTDGINIIMSDGTNILTYLDPKTLKVVKTISVSQNGYAKSSLNELEFINGYIYANVWTTNIIVKIDPENGKVVGKMDLTSLASDSRSRYPNSLEMNGIAFDSISNKVYITGKLWPRLYEIIINE